MMLITPSQLKQNQINEGTVDGSYWEDELIDCGLQCRSSFPKLYKVNSTANRGIHGEAQNKFSQNKKVLLHERKRPTDRGVSSTPSVTRGGVPLPTAGVPPWPGLMGGGTRGGVPPGRGRPGQV